MLRKRVWPVMCCLAFGFLVAACAPKETFILLPEGGEALGSIAVTGGGATRSIETPWQAVGVDERGTTPGTPFRYRTSSAAEVFAAALRRQPLPPTVHILYFETGTEELTEESSERVVDVIESIRDRRWPDVSIIGHSDAAGDEIFNLALSQRRAESVRNVILQWGVDPDVMEVDAHGQHNPLVPTPDNVPEPRNRRVEITVR